MKAEARPAGGAERARLGDDFVAAQAERRQHRIEQPAARTRARMAQPASIMAD